MKKDIVTLAVNGVEHELALAPNQTLLEVLREQLRLTGTKFGCELGECGACTVLLDGRPVLSCLTLAQLCHEKSVTTVEGLSGPEFELIERAFREEGATQCGFCTPGIVLVLSHALSRTEQSGPPEELAANICRCTGYVKILKAYEKALELARG